MITNCRGCGAKMLWTITPAGKKSPVDNDPDPNGTVLVIMPQGLGELLAVVLSKEALDLARAKQVPLHQSHFATCPQREQFRREATARGH